MSRRLLVNALLLPVLLVGGCQWSGDFFKPGKPDKGEYKSEADPALSKSDVPTLEVPPDLTKQVGGDRNSPFGDGGKHGVSKVDLDKAQPEAVKEVSNVLPEVKNARIVRDGLERWLVIAGKPDQYWDSIKEFWQEAGFVISQERPEAGVMETDWAEHKPRVGSGVVRKIVGEVVDSQRGPAERDRFRTRLETNSRGETEIFVSHRGMQEVLNTKARNEITWQPRPPDPDLEAEYLRLLMVRLGSDDDKRQAPGAAAAASGAPKKSKIIHDGGSVAVEMDESFDRAWRRVGLALDRVGFTVEDRDRTKGLYFVRYADPDSTPQKVKVDGMFAKMKNWFNQDKTVADVQYQIQVNNGASSTRVVVLSKTGQPDNGQTSQRILSLLNEQLE